MRTVDLFQKDHTHQLVRKGHFGKRQLQICLRFQTFIQPQGSTDQKLDMTHRHVLLFLYMIGKGFR